MSDPIPACIIRTGSCAPDCPCQSVHVLLLDAAGDEFAAASMSPALARTIAAELLSHADVAEARVLGQQGRLT